MSQIRFEEQQYNTESLDAGLWKRIFVLMRPLRKGAGAAADPDGCCRRLRRPVSDP